MSTAFLSMWLSSLTSNVEDCQNALPSIWAQVTGSSTSAASVIALLQMGDQELQGHLAQLHNFRQRVQINLDELIARSQQLTSSIGSLCLPGAASPQLSHSIAFDGNTTASIQMETGLYANNVSVTFRTHTPGVLVWFGNLWQGDYFSVFITETGILSFEISVKGQVESLAASNMVVFDDSLHAVQAIRSGLGITLVIDGAVVAQAPALHGELSTTGHVYVGSSSANAWQGCLAFVSIDGIDVELGNPYLEASKPLYACSATACQPQNLTSLISDTENVTASINSSLDNASVLTIQLSSALSSMQVKQPGVAAAIVTASTASASLQAAVSSLSSVWNMVNAINSTQSVPMLDYISIYNDNNDAFLMLHTYIYIYISQIQTVNYLIVFILVAISLHSLHIIYIYIYI